MPIALAQGVNLHVVPTEKYKTVRILVRFNTRLNKETITKRTLLSSLLETNSLNYPDQVKLSGKLAELYGASFGINVNKKGNLHWLNVSMNFVNDRYLENTHVLEDAVDFIKEIIFYPNIIDGKFEAETFQREKENLLAYYESVSEDKQVYSSLALQNLYFSQSADQRIPSFGTRSDLENETAESLAAYHEQMLKEDQVDIFVLGDVDETTVTALFKALPFEDRSAGKADVFYTQPSRNVIEERSEQEKVAQSKLNLGYHTDIFYGDENYFALQIFNGVFGGFPHSKLFMNVREKENLAYYASSSIDTFRGFLSVQTGIDGKNRNQVLHLIAQELENIRQGNVTELEIKQTKAMLKNQYLLSLDNAGAVLETEYLDDLIPHLRLEDDEWIRRMEAVTLADVQRVAKRIQLQAIFFLEGEKTDA
ncbi:MULTISPECIES: EF-P 5-aminopentanol modification-associated protein YfmF [unclassified Enterococcus]|uniref:EF-P 5-aminopentanol modification-associated protein YfmF n=1 Tax=unclassified Enterococcus TaxID=2608891 RepID=UPI001CE1A1FD|nr:MULTISPECIES: pitrilysin family protein [unclassified Enterococcus]MCA5014134.1 insulinase family protein [Enterococcus sp. S23]MCA5017646.1 insulinase family protein [Enterococcus sp. S22(2020)]